MFLDYVKKETREGRQFYCSTLAQNYLDTPLYIRSLWQSGSELPLTSGQPFRVDPALWNKPVLCAQL